MDANTGNSSAKDVETLTYESIKAQLLSHSRPLLPPSPSSPSRDLGHAISSLSVHSSLKSALHILNSDLPSAHLFF
jgi:hypothetical protein